MSYFFLGLLADYTVSITSNITFEQLREKISDFTAAGTFSLFMAISFPMSDITADGPPLGKMIFLVFCCRLIFFFSPCRSLQYLI